MAYLLTGGTGFVGRFLVERLLERDGEVFVVVREGSREKLDTLSDRWGHPERVHTVIGDLSEPGLGISAGWLSEHRDRIEHFFHVAAVYDMAADEQRNRVANVDGTRHAVEVANDLGVGCLHHVSSVAVAGSYDGVFSEDMFDEGQPLSHPYHATKFESEGIVRSDARVPWRVYRPAIVVGDSRTGEMDKIDGPYYFFRTLSLAAHMPDVLPVPVPRLGDTNIVPIDYVAAAMDHIAHQPGLDGRAFHLVNPQPQRSVDVLNAFARAAGAPRVFETPMPQELLSFASRLPGVGSVVLEPLGIPPSVVDHLGFTAVFDDSGAREALAGSGIEVPPLDSYAKTLWDYWERELQSS